MSTTQESTAMMNMDGLSGTKKPKTGSFQSLGLSRELLNALNRMGYKTPTPVQRKALPMALAGVDIVCMARTGSGKTCAFLLPMIHKLGSHQSNGGIRGLVLSPTRELANQTYKFAKDMAKFTDLRIATIFGGDGIEKQFDALSSYPDIVIATPGRLMHHLREISTFKLKQVQYVVFDEADRIFEMGFAEQLNEIIRECPVERQTLLFSATMPKMLVQFSRAGLRDPQLIRLDADAQLSDELRLAFFMVRGNEKLAALMYLVKKIIPDDQLSIIFTATRHHSELLHAFFGKIGVTSTIVYGTMDQESRTANLKLFRNGYVSYLIVTDLAARGIDVPLLNNVINFHFPASPKLFVHRCGRAARQGRIGFAFSLVEPEELGFVVDVHHFLGKRLNLCDGEEYEQGSGEASKHQDSKQSKAGEHSGAQVVEHVAPYTLESMTPHDVHLGLIPQDVLDQEGDFVKRCLLEDDSLGTVHRISENGMMQYRRTRQEASRDGVKTAKTIVKQARVAVLHPLIAGCDPHRCARDVVEKNKFVRVLQTFRPAQTVFETGIGTGMANPSGSQSGAKLSAKLKLTKGMEMMRELRKTTVYSLERNRVAAAAAAAAAAAKKEEAEAPGAVDGLESNQHRVGEDACSVDEGASVDEYSEDDGSADERSIDSGSKSNSDDDDDDGGNEKDEDEVHTKQDFASGKSRKGAQAAESKPGAGDGGDGGVKKVRLSIAERKKLKRQGLSADAISKAAQQTVDLPSEYIVSDGKGSGGTAGDFKDPRFYMAYGDEDGQKSFNEEALQPQSNLRGSESLNTMKLDQAVLDIAPDEAADMNNKQRMLRWDSKKKKFVKQTLREAAESKSHGLKRARTESGVVLSKSSRPQGEMYEKWKKRTRKEVGGTDGDDRGVGPSFKVNDGAKEELRSVQEIRKMREKKDNLKMKNMPREKRTKIEAANRKKKQQSQQRKQMLQMNAGGMRRKSKIIVRT